MKPTKGVGETGFYVDELPRQRGFQRLGYSWYDKRGNHRTVEAVCMEKNPDYVAAFLEMFARGVRDRITDNTP